MLVLDNCVERGGNVTAGSVELRSLQGSLRRLQRRPRRSQLGFAQDQFPVLFRDDFAQQFILLPGHRLVALLDFQVLLGHRHVAALLLNHDVVVAWIDGNEFLSC